MEFQKVQHTHTHIQIKLHMKKRTRTAFMKMKRLWSFIVGAAAVKGEGGI